MGVEISVTAHGDSYLDGIEEMKSSLFLLMHTCIAWDMSTAL